MTTTDDQAADLLSYARGLLLDAGDPDVDDLMARIGRWLPDLLPEVSMVYEDPTLPRRLIELVVTGHLQRPARLRARDRERSLQPDWFQLPSAIGYSAYTDRFAVDLQGVRRRVPYLVDLGVTYLHLMPLLQTRPAPNDGGYAVADYRSVRPELGTMADLAELAETLHHNGIALTLDLVLNHVAREHDWAERARAGQERYRRYFRMFPDRRQPDAFERTLPEVFPATAPGSFTWEPDADAWVWTTFNTWQWDLDWSNPDVLCEFVEIILFLANQGVDCLRLDAIAFIWKRLGTDCQNQPEVHAITQVLRAVTHMAAPALVFKAEAIVGPSQVVAYLGTGRHAGRVSDLAYHNSLMVQIWSALAARDGRLLVRAIGSFPPKAITTAWATYVRCHDDIGWAIGDADAAAVGWDGAAHRRFLSDFYSGEFPGSFARGAVFQHNPETGDRRISGSAASLAGVELALESGDEAALELALGRIRCVHAMTYGFGGIPLLYMGDELALLNDYDYGEIAEHAADNRWLHRPAMPWDGAGRSAEEATVSARTHDAVRHLGQVRGSLPALHAAVETSPLEGGHPAVVVFLRRHAAGTLVQVYNVSDSWVTVDVSVVGSHLDGPWVEHLGWDPVSVEGSTLTVPPYAAWWLSADIP